MSANHVAHTTDISRLCDQGKSERSNGVKRVSPGAIRACSQPSNRNTDHNMSRSTGAAIRAAKEVRGANFLAAKPTAKWPINMLRPQESSPMLRLGPRIFRRRAPAGDLRPELAEVMVGVEIAQAHPFFVRQRAPK